MVGSTIVCVAISNWRTGRGTGFRLKGMLSVATVVDTFEKFELKDRAYPEFMVKYVHTNISQAMADDLFSLTDNGS